MKRNLIKAIDKMINAIDIASDDFVACLSLSVPLEKLKDRIVAAELDTQDHPWNEVSNMLTYNMPDHRNPVSPEWTREVAAIFVGRSYTKPEVV